MWILFQIQKENGTAGRLAATLWGCMKRRLAQVFGDGSIPELSHNPQMVFVNSNCESLRLCSWESEDPLSSSNLEQFLSLLVDAADSPIHSIPSY